MILGITGETKVGKTTVANFLKQHYQADVINLDQIAKELYQNLQLRKTVQKLFKESILNQQDQIDLMKLKEIVFKSEKNLNKLNVIMFPAIYQAVKNKLKELKNDLKVVEGSILFQAKLNELTNQNILIKCERKNQIKRNNLIKKMNKKELFFLFQIQNRINDFQNKANFIIENNDSITKLNSQIKHIIGQLKENN